MYMEKEQDVIVAKSAGFCPGVKRAIDKVLELEAAGKKPIYTIGPLIHNKQVTDMLAAKQISSINHPQEAADKTGVLVIRAHGITPQFQQEVTSCGMEVVDATCPLVKRAHDVISKYAQEGYSTVIVGDGGHAEVIGLLGYTQGKGVVVSGPEEARKLPAFDKVNVVSQTTQKESVFYETAEIIKAKAAVCQISNTVCQPTKDRQKETVELAKNADLVIVVGGKHSANTARLALLCQGLAPRVLHIETEAELQPEQVLRPQKIFITAGASTPNWVIDKVANWVRETRRTRNRFAWTARLKGAWNAFVRSSFYTAFAAMALTYVCMKLDGLDVIGVFVVVHFQSDVRKPGVGKFFRAGGQGRLGRQLNGVRRGAGNGGYCRVAGVFTGLGLFGGGVLLSVPPRAEIQTAFLPRNKRRSDGPGLGVCVCVAARVCPWVAVPKSHLFGGVLCGTAGVYALRHAGVFVGQ